MLIDLEFKKEIYSRPDLISDWDASRGLSFKFMNEMSGEMADMSIALREDVGIYWTGLNFDMYIELFTDYQILHPHEEKRKLFEEAYRCPIDSIERKDIMKKFYERIDRPEYGLADNLQQVLLYGLRLIQHPHNKYVLSLTMMPKDIKDKWGEYIGTDPNHWYKEQLHWHFFELSKNDKIFPARA